MLEALGERHQRQPGRRRGSALREAPRRGSSRAEVQPLVESDRRLQRPHRHAVLDNVGTCQKAKLATEFSRAALNYRIEK
jgi:hypothetical protein